MTPFDAESAIAARLRELHALPDLLRALAEPIPGPPPVPGEDFAQGLEGVAFLLEQFAWRPVPVDLRLFAQLLAGVRAKAQQVRAAVAKATGG